VNVKVMVTDTGGQPSLKIPEFSNSIYQINYVCKEKLLEKYTVLNE
jgi:hypothetical protein